MLIKSQKLVNTLIIIGLLIFLVFSVVFIGFKITGFAVLNEVSYTDLVNLSLNGSRIYFWGLQKQGDLGFVRISGSIIGKGSVKIYIENYGEKYLVFDNLNPNLITANVVLSPLEVYNIVNEENLSKNLSQSNQSRNLSIGLNESMEIIKNLSVSDSNLSNETVILNEGLMNISNESFLDNLTLVNASELSTLNVSLSEDISNVSNESLNLTLVHSVSFENICFETCNLTGFNSSGYNLIFEVSDAVMNLEEINYSLRKPKNITIKEEIKQYRAEIGKPVKWVKNVKASEKVDKMVINIPDEAINISVKKIENKKKVDVGGINLLTGYITQDIYNIVSSEKKKEKNNEIYNLLDTSNRTDVIINEINTTVNETNLSVLTRITNEINLTIVQNESNLSVVENLTLQIPSEVNLTVPIISEIEEQNISLLIQEPVEEVEVEYYTEAPYANETKISDYSKEIIVSSNVHYEDILSYTFLPIEVSSEKAIKLRWKIFKEQNLTNLNLTDKELIEINDNGMILKDINFSAYDSDDNGKIDYIEWIVPRLSNQTYELSIQILNVHSYPTLYGNWTVDFNTVGVDNLTITSTIDPSYSSEYTRWSNSSESLYDLKFLEVKCGSEVMPYKWEGINCLENECSMFIANYSCNQTAQEISRVLIARKHVLRFSFGGIDVYAYNSPGNETSESTLNEWRMFHRFPNMTGYTNASSPVSLATANVITYTTSGDIDSSPSVANGYVYVGSQDAKLYQFNASNISQLIASYSAGGSIQSTPAVGDNFVYVLNYDTNLYQLNASNVSQKIANYTTGGGFYNLQSSPTVFNGSVYVGSSNNMVYQFNATNITQKIANFSTGDAVYPSPAVANGYVYVGSNDAKFYQLNASNVSQKIANYTTGEPIYSSATISNGYAYFGSRDYNLYQLNASNVSQKIANYTTGSQVDSSPAVANGYVYVGSHDGKLYQLNASNISLLIATYTTGGNISSSPAITDSYVYVGSNDTRLYQLDASNISILISSYKTNDVILSSPAVVNGSVYVGSNDNKLYQFALDILTPGINFTDPTLANATSTTNTSVEINISITNATDLNEFIWSWNYTNYTIYNNSLVLMYNFDNLSAIGDNTSYAVDVSKYGNNGSFGNGTSITYPNWTTSGKYGSALSFDGRDDFVSINDNPNWDLVTSGLDFTIDLLAKHNNQVGLQMYVSHGPSGSDSWYVMLNAGTLTFAMDSSGVNRITASGGSISDTNWHHITVVKVGNTYGVYLDGQQTAYASSTNTANFSSILRIGRYSDNTYYMNGSIDEFRIYKGNIFGAAPNSGNSNNITSYDNRLNKYTLDKWAFYINQSNLTKGVYPYQGFAKDTSNNTNKTDLRFLTIPIETTPPGINFTDPTLANATSTTNTSVEINISITNATDLNEFIWSWNYTNYTIYNNSLVLMYNFDNISAIGENSTYAVDVSKYGNNGTLVNSPIWNSSGKYGGALQFDGTNDYVTFSATGMPTGERTIELWIYALNGTGTTREIFGYGGNSNNPAFSSFLIYLESDNRNITVHRHYGGGGVLTYNSTFSLANAWHHLAFTTNSSGSQLYLNGQAVLSNTVTVSTYVSGKDGFVGAMPQGTGTGTYVDVGYGYFNGSIDEVRVYNYSLKPEEIQQHYFSNLYKYRNDSWAFYINESNLTIATYTYQGFAKDINSNTNKTDLRFLTVANDTTPPDIKIVNPANNTVIANTTVQINYTYSSDVSTITYEFDSNNTNITITIGSNITFNNLTEIIHNITLYANDSVNNINSSFVNFSIGIRPDINFTDPTLANATSTTNTSVEINISIVEPNLNEFIWSWNKTNSSFYDNSTVLMFNFDNISAIGENSSYAVDVSKYGNNGTLTNGAVWNTSGRYGGGINLDGVNDYVSVADSASLKPSNITILMWVKRAVTGVRHELLAKISGNSGYEFLFLNDKLTFAIGNGVNVVNNQSNGTITDTNWRYVAVVWDGTNAIFYIDGKLDSSTFLTRTVSHVTNALRIGDSTDVPGSFVFNGTIDEVRIWNRSLSAAEIQQHYYSNLYKYATDKWVFYTNQSNLTTGTYTYQGFAADISGNTNKTDLRWLTIDTVPPDIKIVNPLNNSVSNSSTIYINYTYGTDVNTVWYEFISNNTNITITKGSNITFTNLSNLIYNITLYANDSSNNINASFINFSVSADAVPPDITIVNPINNSVIANTTVHVNYTYGTDANTIWYELDSNNTNTTITTGSNITFSGLSKILHNISLYTNDSSNNINRSFVNFSIKSSNPILLILNPTNNTNLSVSTITLNYSSVDTSLHLSWYELDSNNTNITTTINLTFSNLADGYHNITMWNNDTADNQNRSYTSFLVDTIAPTLSILNPLNNTNYTIKNITLNYSVSDLNLDIVWYEFDSNNTNITTTINITFSSLELGYHNITMWVNDTSNNENQAYISFVIENLPTPPSAGGGGGETVTITTPIIPVQPEIPVAEVPVTPKVPVVEIPALIMPPAGESLVGARKECLNITGLKQEEINFLAEYSGLEFCKEEKIEKVEVTTSYKCNGIEININDLAFLQAIIFDNKARLNLDIGINKTEGRYCAWCYDNKQDYDETGIDCGGSCKSCVVEEKPIGIISFKKDKDFSYLLLFLFFIVVGSLILKEEEKIPLKKITIKIVERPKLIEVKADIINPILVENLTRDVDKLNLLIDTSYTNFNLNRMREAVNNYYNGLHLFSKIRDNLDNEEIELTENKLNLLRDRVEISSLLNQIRKPIERYNKEGFVFEKQKIFLRKIKKLKENIFYKEFSNHEKVFYNLLRNKKYEESSRIIIEIINFYSNIKFKLNEEKRIEFATRIELMLMKKRAYAPIDRQEKIEFKLEKEKPTLREVEVKPHIKTKTERIMDKVHKLIKENKYFEIIKVYSKLSEYKGEIKKFIFKEAERTRPERRVFKKVFISDLEREFNNNVVMFYHKVRSNNYEDAIKLYEKIIDLYSKFDLSNKKKFADRLKFLELTKEAYRPVKEHKTERFEKVNVHIENRYPINAPAADIKISVNNKEVKRLKGLIKENDYENALILLNSLWKA